MDRRKFFSLTGAGSALLAASKLGTRSARAQTLARAPASGELPPLKAKLGHQLGVIDDKALNYCARLGVDLIGGNAKTDPDQIVAKTEQLKATRDIVEKHKIKWEWTACGLLNAGDVDTEKHPAIILGQSPERDRDIEQFNNLIKSCAEVGIPTIKYQFALFKPVRTGTVKGRGDSVDNTLNWDVARQQKLPNIKAAPLQEDEFWERIDYFLSRVVPVATQYKVNIACHPQDATMYSGYRGVDYGFLGRVEGLKKLISMHESPYHGLNFCQGTIGENMDHPATEILDAIRYFGSRKKIFNVHFRNIRGHRGDFTAELFPDEGDVDLVTCIKAYREVGYDKALEPDHAPDVDHPDPNARDVNYAFELGYIRGLIQSQQHVV